MDVRTNSEYLEFLAGHLDEFKSAFEEFMTHHVENSGFGGMAVGMAPAVLPKDNSDKARVRVLTDELNRLAGALMDLSSVTGVRLAVRGAGMLDPFVNWQRMLEPKPLLDAPVVRGCCLQAAGRLEGLKAKAEALSSPAIEPSLLHPLVWAVEVKWNPLPRFLSLFLNRPESSWRCSPAYAAAFSVPKRSMYRRVTRSTESSSVSRSGALRNRRLCTDR